MSMGVLIQTVLAIRAAATELGVSRSTLYRKMKKHGVVAPNDQP
ncbi:hypothetical protein J3P89_14375 [Pseudomonas sp. Z1-14]